MKQYSYKVVYNFVTAGGSHGHTTRFHKELKAARKSAKYHKGRLWEHNPFSADAKPDEFGSWVEITENK